MANEIVVRMSGDDDLSKVAASAQANVSGSFDKMARDAGDAGKKIGRDTASGFDKARDSFDDGERRVVGFRDAVTGTGDVMKGFRDGDVVTLATGIADLASAFANLGVDAIKVAVNFARTTAARVADTAATVAHTAASAASSAATGVMTAAQWALNAAMSANPILLVVVAIAALVAALVLAWQHSETFRNIVTGAFDTVVGAAKAAFGWVRDNWPLLLAILTGPFGLAVLAIVRNWDTIKETAAGAKDFVVGKFEDLIGFFTGLPERLKNAAGDLWGWIEDSFREAVNSVIDLWNGIKFPSYTFPKISTPLGDIGGQTVGGWKLPQLPRLALGGITNGPVAAIVGDNPGGREAIIPLPPGGGGLTAGGQTIELVIMLDTEVVGRATVKASQRAGGLPIRIRTAS